MVRARSLAVGAGIGIGAALLAAPLAGAQVASVPLEPAHVIRVDATRLVPGQAIYQTSLERDAITTPLGTRILTIAQAPYAGSSAWLMIDARNGDAVPGLDSLFVDLGTLRPIHWGSTLGRARLSAEFRGDTVYAGTSAPAGRRSMVTVMPVGTLVNGPMLEATLRLLPLRTGWEDSTSTLTVSLAGASALPTRLSVIGEDRVRVPAGEFDCWIVAVHAGDSARGMYWVSKQDPIVVRSALDVPEMGGAQLVSVLTRVSR